MAIGYIEPFDLEMIFINIFGGSYTIFIAICLLFISIMAAKWRMPNVVLLSSMMLFMSLIGSQIGTGAMYIGFGFIFMIGIALVITRYFNK
jgi:hypothetical protein|tara:strand:+ start:236 stop:508 length:273 start_codon:yes stop_codon:yes gene_type:complete